MHRTASLRNVLSLCSVAVATAACLPPESDTGPGTSTTTTSSSETTTTDTTTTDTTTTDTTTTDTTTTDTTTTTTTEPDPCGDGVLDPGEECDDGNKIETDECTPACTLPVCGDGFLHPDTEVCDGDGCDPTCSEVMPVLQVTGYCALLFDGRVKCWGHGQWGALGLGDTKDRGDQPGEMGTALPAVNLGSGAAPVELTSGYAHNCALMKNGKVKCWGNNAPGCAGTDSPDAYIGNNSGEMGNNLPYVNLGTGRTALVVRAGRGHTCAILDDHSLKCWGLNDFGQLGLGDNMNRGRHDDTMGDNLPTVDLGTGHHAVQIAPADDHTCALLDDGSVKCWGMNYNGELGLGDKVPRGANPGEMGDNLPAVDLGSDVTVKKLVAGGTSACALLEDGRVRCWGKNDCQIAGYGGGAVGDEPTDMGDYMGFVPIGPGVDALDISMGNNGACALVSSGEVRCWGCDTNGQLAHVDTAPTMWTPAVNLGTGAVPKSIYIGYPRACAILENGTLKCWGGNAAGQLGLGDTKNRGEDDGTMGDNLPIVHVYDDRW